MRVAALALPGTAGSPVERGAWAERAAARARAAGAELVVLPEAYLPGYRHGRADAEGDARALAGRIGGHVAVGFLEGDGSWLGLGSPDGRWARYRKRHPSPDEARHWRAGDAPGVVSTALGRVGLLVCADLLEPARWEELRGVDVIAVAAAWPDYHGRAGSPAHRLVAAWLRRVGVRHRDAMLAAGARATGATVVFAGAVGRWRGAEGFAGGGTVWWPDGTAAGPIAEVRTAPPGPPVRLDPTWRAFMAAYRRAARGRGVASWWR